MSEEKKTEDAKPFEGKFFSREELARVSADLLHKTLGGIDALKETLPKEAAQFIANRKEDLVKGLSKEFIQSLITGGIETFFSVVRQHKLELTIGIKKVNETPASPTPTKHRSSTQNRKSTAPRDRGRKPR